MEDSGYCEPRYQDAGYWDKEYGGIIYVKHFIRSDKPSIVTPDFEIGTIYKGVHFALLGPEEGMKALMAMKGWSITVNEATQSETESEAAYKGPYKAEFTVKDDILYVELCGRIDSMSSNDMLAKYNAGKIADGYKSIVIDCTNLTYISSAGLRVLMIMKKDLKDGNLYLVNVTDSVKEILEMTGFDSIVSIA